MGLCSTISYASEKNNFLIEANDKYSISSLVLSQTNTLNTVKEKHTNALNFNNVDHILNKPLFSILSPMQSAYTPRKKSSKNELFELATLFNDKLQQILAYFNLTKASKHDSYMHSDKPNDSTSIKLSSDCKNK